MQIETQKYDLSDPDREARLEELVGPANRWRETRDFQIRLLGQLGLRREDRLLDLGCGTLRAGLPLIGYLEKGCYTGVDIDADCISEARSLVTDFGLAETKEPKLLRSEVFGRDMIEGTTTFDVIWCYQVFIHLTPSQTELAFSAIRDLLAKDGCAYVSVRPDNSKGALTEIGTWRDFALTTGSIDAYLQTALARNLTAEILGTLGQLGLNADRGGAGNALLKLKRLETDV